MVHSSTITIRTTKLATKAGRFLRLHHQGPTRPQQQHRRLFPGGSRGSPAPLFHPHPRRFLSTSTGVETTEVPAISRHGPFGNGGTVVGFSEFDGVRAAFEENFARRLELGSQLVIYRDGEKIVDLYGYAPETETYNDGEGYDGDTLQCVFSSGKNAEAVVVAMLVDRGLVGYKDPVARHWPEFAAGGKKDVTIEDVMRHAGGVPFVLDPGDPRTTNYITPSDVENPSILDDKLAGAERYPPAGAASPLCYHAFTRGFLVDAILRRVDPLGRSLGRFWREEVTEPLSGVAAAAGGGGDTVTFACGMPEAEQARHAFADIDVGNRLYRAATEVIPGLLLGKGPNPESGPFVGLYANADVRRGGGVTWVGVPPSFGFIDSPGGRSLGVSSAGMLSNARSMALVQQAAMLEGSHGGVRLLRPETVETSMGGVVARVDHAMEVTMAISRGGYGSFADSLGSKSAHNNKHHTRVWHPDDSEAYGGFVGWGGIGGSLSLVDRTRNISFAYCMNAFGLNLLGGPRTRRILLELQRALAEA